MSDHMEAAVEAGAWEYIANEHHMHNGTRTYGEIAHIIITAALPHIREMIAEEIRSNITQGYSIQQLEYGLALEDAAQTAYESIDTNQLANVIGEAMEESHALHKDLYIAQAVKNWLTGKDHQ